MGVEDGRGGGAISVETQLVLGRRKCKSAIGGKDPLVGEGAVYLNNNNYEKEKEAKGDKNFPNWLHHARIIRKNAKSMNAGQITPI